MDAWLPARYLGSSIGLDTVATCADIMNLATTNETKITMTCKELPFNNLTSFYYFANANKKADAKATLIDISNLTDAEFTSLYDVSIQGSMGQRIQEVDKIISS